MKNFLYSPVFYIVIVAVIISIIYIFSPNISCGINGTIETRCIKGYMFSIDNKGTVRQIIDSFGKGAKC